MNFESRANNLAGVDLRDGATGKNIEGFAAVYYDGTPATEYRLSDKIIERVHPGAFKKVLESRAEIFGLYHHDETQLLGRRSSGTLLLKDEARGLHYSIPFDSKDPIHQTVAARIARKDVTGSSFTFAAKDQQFEKRSSDGMIIRNIYSFDRVKDVGPTHLPCYPGSSAEFRSLSDVQLLAIEAAAIEALGIEPPTPIEFYKYLGRR